MNHQTFYLFRHGLATQGQNGYGEQTLTAGLLPDATVAVKKLGEFLAQFSFDLRLTSPVLRCQQTAEIVSKIIRQDFTTDQRVTEYWPEVFPPLYQRLTDLTFELKQLPNKHIAICTHGAVISGLTRLIRGERFSQDDVTVHPRPAGLVILSTDLHIPTTIHNFEG